MHPYLRILASTAEVSTLLIVLLPTFCLLEPGCSDLQGKNRIFPMHSYHEIRYTEEYRRPLRKVLICSNISVPLMIVPSSTVRRDTYDPVESEYLTSGASPISSC